MGIELRKKFLEKFGTLKEFSCELKYTKDVLEFIGKIEQAHKDAANSTLKF